MTRENDLTCLFKTTWTLGTLTLGRLTAVVVPWQPLTHQLERTQTTVFSKVFLWEGAAPSHSVISALRFLAKINSDNGVEKVWRVSNSVTLWWHLCLQMMLSFWHHQTVASDELWHSLQLAGVWRGGEHLHVSDCFCPGYLIGPIQAAENLLFWQFLGCLSQSRVSQLDVKTEPSNYTSSWFIDQLSFQLSSILRVGQWPKDSDQENKDRLASCLWQTAAFPSWEEPDKRLQPPAPADAPSGVYQKKQTRQRSQARPGHMEVDLPADLRALWEKKYVWAVLLDAKTIKKVDLLICNQHDKVWSPSVVRTLLDFAQLLLQPQKALYNFFKDMQKYSPRPVNRLWRVQSVEFLFNKFYCTI